MTSPAGPTNLEATNAQVKRLVNAQLKNVCKGAGLPVSGAKAALQSRIISHLQRLASQGNYEGLYQLKGLVHNPNADTSPHTAPSSSARPYVTNPMATHYPYQSTSDTLQYRNSPSMNLVPQGIGTRGPHFKPSPFFNILEPLTPVIECQELARESNRDTVHATINLRPETAEMINKDKNIRVMIYCTADAGLSPFTRVEISFPHQVEIKVNQDETKANLRGLKNKPGTTRPADITDLLRKRPGYNNDVAVTYALTKTPFFLVINLVRQIPVKDLVGKLKGGKFITKDRVIREMVFKAEDRDVVATSTILSLKCPLSTLRIEVPCRSTVCTHNQCFDATSFLQLQEQAPTWLCPVCNKNVSFENLHVDQYVGDILSSTPKSADQVTIEPNGEWFLKSGTKASSFSQGRHTSSDNDDDLVEIQGVAPPIASIKSEFNQEPNMLRTPPIPSREPSTASAVREPNGTKRRAEPVVDLTLSSDEDEEPVRPPKRQQTKLSNGASQLNISDGVPYKSHSMSTTPHYQTYTPNPYPIPSHYGPAQYGGPP